MGIGGLDRQATPVGHGVARIHREIEDGGLQLVGVGLHLPKPRREHRLDGDRLAQGAVDHLREARHQAVHIERLRIERLAAGEGQETLGERGGPPRAVQRLAGRAPEPRRLFGQVAVDGVEIADDHLEQVVEVVGDAPGELADGLHFLGLTQRLLVGPQLRGAFDDLRLQGGVQFAQRLLSLAALGDLALGLLDQPDVVDGDRGFRREARHSALRSLAEDAGRAVAEKQASEDLAGPRHHRYGQIGADRQVPLGHPLAWRVAPVARVLGDVVGPDDALAVEGRREHLGVPRHRELRERFDRRSGQGVEHVALAPVIQHIVEERPEFRARKLHAGVGHGLDEAMEFGFGGQRRARTVQDLQRAAFFGDRFLGLPLGGAVAQDLYEPGDLTVAAVDRMHLARGPDAACVLAQPPAFVTAAAALAGGVAQFAAQLVGVLEQTLQGTAQHFVFCPAQDVMCAGAPTGHPAFPVDADDGGVGGRLDDLPPFGGRDGLGPEARGGVSHG
jgi:hypothetical protein